MNMKSECMSCPLDKSGDKCIRRQCQFSDMPIPAPVVIPESRWHLAVGDTIGDSQVKVCVTWVSEETGDFEGQVVELRDPEKDCGHYGSYVTLEYYYRFTRHQNPAGVDFLWEILPESTDRFHREGSTGAQFLLYWWPEVGFSFDLDS